MNSFEIAILIPTLRRHKRLENIVKNLLETIQTPFVVYFLVEHVDPESIAECHKLKSLYPVVEYVVCYEMCVPKAFNSGYNKSLEPLIFIGGDDLVFQPEWLDEAIVRLKQNPWLQVVGTWDGYTHGGNSGYVVKRSYIVEQSGVIDKPGLLLNEDYHHYFADTEFMHTAQNRGVFSHNPKAVVLHEHYTLGSRYEFDSTYEKNQNPEHVKADKDLYNSRCHLFRGVTSC